MKLDIKTYGKGNPIYFFTGLGLDYRCYMPLIQQLAHINTVYAVTLPPFGKSTHNCTTFAQYTQQLQLELKKHQIKNKIPPSQIILTGHSAGAYVLPFLNAKKRIFLAPPTKTHFTTRKRLLLELNKSATIDFFKAPFHVIRMAINNMTTKNRVKVFTPFIITLIDSCFANNTKLYSRKSDTILQGKCEYIFTKHKRAIIMPGGHNFPITHPKETVRMIKSLIP